MMKRSVITLVVLCTMAVVVTGFLLWQLGTMTSRACLKQNGVEITTTKKSDYFSSNYKEARDKFLEAARVSGGKLYSIQNPEFGSKDDPLFIDVAYFGLKNNKDALVISSGTHGVEGFAGSGIQIGLLRSGFTSRLPPHLSLLMIHAINPYGMAHLRRVNEDNVDLNRNFRDRSQAYPKNPDYETLADAIAPTSISFWSEVVSWWRILWFRITAGKTAAQAAVSKGQYSHPTGLFYGGTFDTWSNKSIRSIFRQYFSNTKRIVVVDVHTGLGEYGNVKVILNVPENSAQYRRAIAIWGPDLVITTVTGDEISPDIFGPLKLAIPEMLPNAEEVTAISLEFGTIPLMDVFKALRAENWLHHHGGSEHLKAREVKMCLLRAFYPGTRDWETAIWKKGTDIVECAVASFSY